MLPLYVVLVLGVFAQTFADEPEAIVGGANAYQGQFPYQISMRIGNSWSNYHTCGGSIIGSNFILTAAHCVEGQRASDIKIVTGHLYSTGGQLRDVRKVVIHPNYISSSSAAWQYDVAVIQLTQPITFDKYQSPIELASQEPAPGTNCVVSGWGKTSTNGGIPGTLQYATSRVIDLNSCRNSHQGMPLNKSHLCIFNQRGIGVCQGDSGGPLVCNGKLTGIFSWVLPCALGEPDACCNVATVRQWILDTCARM